jgi:hypothetical protein
MARTAGNTGTGLSGHLVDIVAAAALAVVLADRNRLA